MFCQNCGNTIIEGLNYCNRCGFRMNGAIEKTERPMMMPTGKPTNIIVTLSIVTGLIVLTGIGTLIPLLIFLVPFHMDIPAVMAIILMFLGTLFGISWLLIRQISRALDFYFHGNVSNQTSSNATQQPAQLFNQNTGQIEAPREPFISVTENTTRILDPVAQERNR